MATKYPWIVLKYDCNPNKMICERCKAEYEMPEGRQPVNMFMALMETFAKGHKHCKVQYEK